MVGRFRDLPDAIWDLLLFRGFPEKYQDMGYGFGLLITGSQRKVSGLIGMNKIEAGNSQGIGIRIVEESCLVYFPAPSTGWIGLGKAIGQTAGKESGRDGRTSSTAVRRKARV